MSVNIDARDVPTIFVVGADDPTTHTETLTPVHLRVLKSTGRLQIGCQETKFRDGCAVDRTLVWKDVPIFDDTQDEDNPNG